MRLTFPDQVSSPGDPLPEYGTPPVVETSVGIQFDGLSEYTSLAAANFWERVRQQYPVVSEVPPLEPSFETFGPSDSTLSQPEFKVLTGPIRPRFLMANTAQTELLQLQSDRLFFNWRKMDRADQYPRYVHAREELKASLEKLADWVASEKLGEFNPTQCEAAYVNRIPLTDEGGKGCGLSVIFPWLSGLMGVTEDGSFQFRRRLNDDKGEPIARLHLTLRYGTDESGAREAQLMLHVRGRPTTGNIDGCLAMIDAEREVIVRTFTEITSDAAHRMWERRQ